MALFALAYHEMCHACDCAGVKVLVGRFKVVSPTGSTGAASPDSR